MVFHAKAVEVYSSAFRTLESYDLERDLQVGPGLVCAFVGFHLAWGLALMSYFKHRSECHPVAESSPGHLACHLLSITGLLSTEEKQQGQRLSVAGTQFSAQSAACPQPC